MVQQMLQTILLAQLFVLQLYQCQAVLFEQPNFDYRLSACSPESFAGTIPFDLHSFERDT
jgi:hypothetical protein